MVSAWRGYPPRAPGLVAHAATRRSGPVSAWVRIRPPNQVDQGVEMPVDAEFVVTGLVRRCLDPVTLRIV